MYSTNPSDPLGITPFDYLAEKISHIIKMHPLFFETIITGNFASLIDENTTTEQKKHLKSFSQALQQVIKNSVDVRPSKSNPFECFIEAISGPQYACDGFQAYERTTKYGLTYWTENREESLYEFLEENKNLTQTLRHFLGGNVINFIHKWEALESWRRTAAAKKQDIPQNNGPQYAVIKVDSPQVQPEPNAAKTKAGSPQVQPKPSAAKAKADSSQAKPELIAANLASSMSGIFEVKTSPKGKTKTKEIPKIDVEANQVKIGFKTNR